MADGGCMGEHANRPSDDRCQTTRRCANYQPGQPHCVDGSGNIQVLGRIHRMTGTLAVICPSRVSGTAAAATISLKSALTRSRGDLA